MALFTATGMYSNGSVATPIAPFALRPIYSFTQYDFSI